MTEWMGIIIMKCNNVGYLLKEGFLGIFRHGFMSFAAVIVTVACLLIVGSFSSLTYNVNIMVEELNKTNEILVYVDSDLPDAEARSIGTKINRISNVHQATFVSREEALKKFVEDHEGDEQARADAHEPFLHLFRHRTPHYHLDEAEHDGAAVQPGDGISGFALGGLQTPDRDDNVFFHKNKGAPLAKITNKTSGYINNHLILYHRKIKMQKKIRKNVRKRRKYFFASLLR